MCRSHSNDHGADTTNGQVEAAEKKVLQSFRTSESEAVDESDCDDVDNKSKDGLE